jgi:Zn-finger nucleic acid-binding protein
MKSPGNRAFSTGMCAPKSISRAAYDAYRSTHFPQEGFAMFCPVCKSVELVMTDRQGIEIDHCPTCRGIWLDRGELDKLIERSVQLVSSGSAPAVPSQDRSHGHDSRQGFKDSDFGHKDYGHGQQGQRRSFWRELFD